MTSQSNERIPEWTQGDRLRKARSLTGLTTREFAERIGVSQATVTNAENDNRAVRKITLNAWSLVTGVPISWLTDGEGAPTPPNGPGESTPDAVAKLAASKRSTTRRATTHGYVSPAAA